MRSIVAAGAALFCAAHAFGSIDNLSGAIGVWDFADGNSTSESGAPGTNAYVGVDTNGGLDDTFMSMMILSQFNTIAIDIDAVSGGNGAWHLDSRFTLTDPSGMGWLVAESGSVLSFIEFAPDESSGTPGTILDTMDGPVASAGDYLLRINNPGGMQFNPDGLEEMYWLQQSGTYTLELTNIPAPSAGLLFFPLFAIARRRVS